VAEATLWPRLRGALDINVGSWPQPESTIARRPIAAILWRWAATHPSGDGICRRQERLARRLGRPDTAEKPAAESAVGSGGLSAADLNPRQAGGLPLLNSPDAHEASAPRECTDGVKSSRSHIRDSSRTR